MTFFLLLVIYPVAYVYGNHRNYPIVFVKLRKCLTTVSMRAYTARRPNTHFDRQCVNQSECRKLQGHIIILNTVEYKIPSLFTFAIATKFMQTTPQGRLCSLYRHLAYLIWLRHLRFSWHLN